MNNPAGASVSLVPTNKQNHCTAVVFRSIKSVFFINSLTYQAAFPVCSSFHPFPSAYAHTTRFFLREAEQFYQ